MKPPFAENTGVRLSDSPVKSETRTGRISERDYFDSPVDDDIPAGFLRRFLPLLAFAQIDSAGHYGRDDRRV